MHIILDYIKNNSCIDDLNEYNCTDFGIDIGNKASLDLPTCDGDRTLGGGPNAGALGEHLRKSFSNNSAEAKESNGNYAPANKKGC